MGDKNEIVITTLLEEVKKDQICLTHLNKARLEIAMALIKGVPLTGVLKCLIAEDAYVINKGHTIHESDSLNSYEVHLTAIPKDTRGKKEFRKLYLFTNGGNAPIADTMRKIREGKTVTIMTKLDQESARHFADMYTQIGGSAYPYLHVEEISH